MNLYDGVWEWDNPEWEYYIYCIIYAQIIVVRCYGVDWMCVYLLIIATR